MRKRFKKPGRIKAKPRSTYEHMVALFKSAGAEDFIDRLEVFRNYDDPPTGKSWYDDVPEHLKGTGVLNIITEMDKLGYNVGIKYDFDMKHNND